MITTKDNLRIQKIEQNEAEPIMLGTKKVRIRMMNNAVAERFDRYVAEAEISYSEDKKDLIVNMTKNRSLIPKCVSLIILHSWFKVTFFHWMYWRYLDRHYSQAELGEPLRAGMSMGESMKFFESLVFLQDNSQMIQKATRGIIRNTVAAPNSGQETV